MKKAAAFDFIIVGAGMVGLTLALGLAREQYTVAVVEAKEPNLVWDDAQLPVRVSAINLHSYELWKKLGVWERVNSKGFSVLDKMQVWDSDGGGEIEFDSAEVGAAQLGFIVENRAVISAAWACCQLNESISFFVSAKASDLITREEDVQLTLENGDVLKAACLIGADGANSWVRNTLKIPVKKRPYQQQALVAVIETEQSHQQTALQSFLPTGPLGLLPLQDERRMSIVWSADAARVEQVLAMDEGERNSALTEAMQWRLGKATFLMQPVAFPLVMRHATRYVAPRIALLGDAAHTIHPLAGQGVNLGLKDVASFIEQMQIAKVRGRDVGAMRVLRAYERSRKGDNTAMLLAMRAFKEGFIFDATWWVTLRSLGLNTVNQWPFLKRIFMRYQAQR